MRSFSYNSFSETIQIPHTPVSRLPSICYTLYVIMMGSYFLNSSIFVFSVATIKLQHIYKLQERDTSA